MTMLDKRGSSGLRGPSELLLELFLDEVRASATGEEELAFYRSVGGHLAERFPIAAQGDVGVFERELNSVLQQTGLGSVHVSVAQDALLIRHEFAPTEERPSEQVLQHVMPAVLEGAYDAWLRSLGSGPRLHTTVSSHSNSHVELRHGL